MKHIVGLVVFVVCMFVGVLSIQTVGYMGGLFEQISAYFTNEGKQIQTPQECMDNSSSKVKPENQSVRKKFEYTRDHSNVSKFSSWFRGSNFIAAEVEIQHKDESSKEIICYEFISRVSKFDPKEGRVVNMNSWTIEVSRQYPLTKTFINYRIQDENLDGVVDTVSDSGYSWEELQEQYNEALGVLPN